MAQPAQTTHEELLEEAKATLEELGPERLRGALDYLRYLASWEATDEILAIPGLAEEIREGLAQIERGESVPFEQIRKDE